MLTWLIPHHTTYSLPLDSNSQNITRCSFLKDCHNSLNTIPEGRMVPSLRGLLPNY